MKTWRIWGYENDKRLQDLLIAADSFDEALKKAREINGNYNTGQIAGG